jgi:hypothetical protein
LDSENKFKIEMDGDIFRGLAVDAPERQVSFNAPPTEVPAEGFDFGDLPTSSSPMTYLLAAARDTSFANILPHLSTLTLKEAKDFGSFLAKFCPTSTVELGLPVTSALDQLNTFEPEKLRAAIEHEYARVDMVVGRTLLFRLLHQYSSTRSVSGQSVIYHFGKAWARIEIQVSGMDYNHNFVFSDDFLDTFADMTKLRLVITDLDLVVGTQIAAVLQFTRVGSSYVSTVLGSLGERRSASINRIKAEAQSIANAVSKLPTVYGQYFATNTAEVLDIAVREFAPALYKAIHDTAAAPTDYDLPRGLVKDTYAEDNLTKAAAIKISGGQALVADAVKTYNNVRSLTTQALNRTKLFDNTLAIPEFHRAAEAVAVGAATTGAQLTLTYATNALQILNPGETGNWLCETAYGDGLAMVATYLNREPKLVGGACVITLYPWQCVLEGNHDMLLAKIVAKCQTMNYGMTFSTNPNDPYVLFSFMGPKTVKTAESSKLLAAYLLRQLLWSTSILRAWLETLGRGIPFFPAAYKLKQLPQEFGTPVDWINVREAKRVAELKTADDAEELLRQISSMVAVQGNVADAPPAVAVERRRESLPVRFANETSSGNAGAVPAPSSGKRKRDDEEKRADKRSKKN